MPGRNTSTSPSSSASARHDGALDDAFQPVVAPPREPADFDRMGSPGDVDDRRGSGPAGGARRRAKRAVSAVADIARMRRSGRNVAADLEGQRQAEVGGQVALVDLVEDHGGDAGQLGVVLQPPGQHALGEHLDTGRWADRAVRPCVW